MDPSKVKGSPFGSIYYIGSGNEEKKDEIYKMKVVDLSRPMTVGFILVMITAINISMTVYLLRPSACTVSTPEDTEPLVPAVSHWPWQLEDADSKPQNTSVPVSEEGKESDLNSLEVLVPPYIYNTGNHEVHSYRGQSITLMGSDPDVRSREGDGITLPCEARGYPKPEIMWIREEGNNYFNHYHNQSEMGEFMIGSSLVFDNVTTDQEATYTCVADNGVPPAASKKVDLRVCAIDEPWWCDRYGYGTRG